jgi:hypothetical protein
VLIADELTLSDILLIEPELLKGIVMGAGGATLARLDPRQVARDPHRGRASSASMRFTRAPISSSTATPARSTSTRAATCCASTAG